MNNFSEEACVLLGETLQGLTPDDIRHWLTQHTTEKDMATAYAKVSNQSGRLFHCLDEENCPAKVRESFHCWWELDCELCTQIIQVLEKENLTLHTSCKTAKIGTHYIITPFMVRNGFRDASGWWVEK